MRHYVMACTVAELPAPGTARRFEVDGVPISIVAAEGELFAIDDTCSHDEVSLSDGEVDGHTVECWLHGSRFDVRTGKALCLPARKSIEVFDIKIEGDGVYVSISPNAAATTKLESNAR